MKKLFIACLIILCIVCAGCGVVSFFVYQAVSSGDYSKIPLVSLLKGSQADLGVKYTEADATSVLNTGGIVATNACPAGTTCSSVKATYIGIKAVDLTLTNQQTTALINEWITLSKNAPFTNAQVRVNADGTVDFSAMVSISRLRNFILSSDVPQADVDQVMPYISAFGDSFPIETTGTLTITNNQVSDNITKFQIGLFPLPSSVFSDNQAAINSFLDDRLQLISGLSISELSFTGGQTTFKGTVPQTMIFPKP